MVVCTRVVLGEIICLVVSPWFPFHFIVALHDAVTNPMVPHVDCA